MKIPILITNIFILLIGILFFLIISAYAEPSLCLMDIVPEEIESEQFQNEIISNITDSADLEFINKFYKKDKDQPKYVLINNYNSKEKQALNNFMLTTWFGLKNFYKEDMEIIVSELRKKNIRTLALLIDATNSMRSLYKIYIERKGVYSVHMKTARLLGLELMKKVDFIDKIGLFIFKDYTYFEPVINFSETDAKKKIKERLDLLTTNKEPVVFSGSETYIYTVAFDAIKAMKKINGRKALIMITDGRKPVNEDIIEKESVSFKQLPDILSEIDFFYILSVNILNREEYKEISLNLKPGQSPFPSKTGTVVKPTPSPADALTPVIKNTITPGSVMKMTPATGGMTTRKSTPTGTPDVTGRVTATQPPLPSIISIHSPTVTAPGRDMTATPSLIYRPTSTGIKTLQPTGKINRVPTRTIRPTPASTKVAGKSKTALPPPTGKTTPALTDTMIPSPVPKTATPANSSIRQEDFIRATNSNQAAESVPFVFNKSLYLLFINKENTIGKIHVTRVLVGRNPDPAIFQSHLISGLPGYNSTNTSVAVFNNLIYIVSEENRIERRNGLDIIKENYLYLRAFKELMHTPAIPVYSEKRKDAYNPALFADNSHLLLAYWNDGYLKYRIYTKQSGPGKEWNTHARYINKYSNSVFVNNKEKDSLYYYNDSSIYQYIINPADPEKSLKLSLMKNNSEVNEFRVVYHPFLKSTGILRFDKKQLILSLIYDNWKHIDFIIRTIAEDKQGQINSIISGFDVIPAGAKDFLITWIGNSNRKQTLNYQKISIPGNWKKLPGPVDLPVLSGPESKQPDIKVINKWQKIRNPRLISYEKEPYLFFSAGEGNNMDIYYKKLNLNEME